MDTQPPPRTHEQSSARSALIWGFILIVVGGAALIGQFWPDAERYIPLAIGLTLLVIFAINRAYVALVAGAIMTGLGIGILVSEAIANVNASGAAVTLGLAGGFLSIWIISELMRLRERHFWPIIPGTILGLVGIGLSVDLFSEDWSKYLVPVIAVAIGVVIMLIGFARMNQGHGGSTV